MATLTIRNLPDHVHAALRTRAAASGRSMESEARLQLEAGLLRSQPYDHARADAATDALRHALRAANGGTLPTGVVDEFIAERRAEAERERR